MKKSILSTSLVTGYLLVYHTIFQLSGFSDLVIAMFILAPFLMGWMVASILKDKSVPVIEFEQDQEFGYADKPRGMKN